jgi:hypothetical protein
MRNSNSCLFKELLGGDLAMVGRFYPCLSAFIRVDPRPIKIFCLLSLKHIKSVFICVHLCSSVSNKYLVAALPR